MDNIVKFLQKSIYCQKHNQNKMFENRTKKEKIAIYVFISLAITILLAMFHLFIQGWNIYVVIIVANVWFFCLFYILYLPVKYKG